MTLKKSSSIFLLCLTFLVVSHADPKMILVTKEFDGDFTGSSATGWFVNGRVPTPQDNSICGGSSLFGGFRLFQGNTGVLKHFDSKVDHSQLFISFEIFSFNSISDTEVFYIFIDNVIVHSIQLSRAQQGQSKANCGNPAQQNRIFTVSFQIPHFRRDFQMQFDARKMNNQESTSWGIRNLQILARSDASETKLFSEDFMQTGFAKDLDGWKLEGVRPQEAFGQCFGRDLFGGPNIFVQGTAASKQFHNLPEHLGIIVNLDLWLIDSVAQGQTVEITIDGQSYQSKRPDSFFNDGFNLCGNPSVSDRQSPVSLFFPHTGSSMNLQIKAKFGPAQGQRSFGIQNLRILTTNCPKENCTIVARELMNTPIDQAPGWVSLVQNRNAAFPTSLKRCNSVTHVLGIDSRIYRRFDTLQKHTKVRISFKLWTTGTWSPSSSFVIVINDVIAKAYVSTDFEQLRGCDHNSHDTIRNYYIDVDHRNHYLEFKVLSKQSTASSGFTISDFILFAYEIPEFTNLVASELNSKSFQASSITGWLVRRNSVAAAVQVTNCGQFSLFGGFNSFGLGTSIVKSFNNLNPHEFIYLTFEFYIIDSWDFEELIVFIDNEFVSATTNTKAWIGSENVCGSHHYEEEPKIVSIIFPHTRNHVTVTLLDTLNQKPDDESWGIRNFHLGVGTFEVCDPKNETCFGTSLDCVIIYSECFFKGDSLELCSGILDRDLESWNIPVRSVKIPQGQTLHILRGPSYDQTQECITQ